MPGPFGVLNRRGCASRKPAPFAAGNLFEQSCSMLIDEAECQIGIVERRRSRTWTSTYQAPDGTLAILHGHCCDPRSGKQFDAAAVLTALQDEGAGLWDSVEGAFLAVVYDLRRNRLQLVNDRLSILPTYWYADATRFCFAPALRYLPVDLQCGPADPTSVVHFLSIGKYPGAHTPLAAVSLLDPATRLDVDLTTLDVARTHYWELTYRTEPRTSTVELVEDLGSAIERATDLFTRPEAGSGGLFLSGGWDSRSLLGASLATKRPLARVITNGERDDIAGSDTWLARRLARDCGLPYFFSQRAPEAGEERWLEGLWLCEVATESSPGNFGIQRLPDEQFVGLDYMLKGDVTWGSGDLTSTADGVINKNFPWPLEDNVLSVLSPRLRADAAAMYLGAIEDELARCPNDHPADRQQWLWQMSGINRYIFGLGYFDEEFIQIRRPLVSRLVLDQWVRVPFRLRIHKNLFLESVHRRYPKLFAFGRNHVSHLADYYYHMAEFVRERTLANLASGCDLGGLLDLDECLRRVENFYPTQRQKQQPDARAHLRHRIHDRHAWRYHRTRWYGEKPVTRLRTSDASVVFRLYLLLEWFHHQRYRTLSTGG
jgi:hypothetical protein